MKGRCNCLAAEQRPAALALPYHRDEAFKWPMLHGKPIARVFVARLLGLGSKGRTSVLLDKHIR
jgi:hypothetical protein